MRSQDPQSAGATPARRRRAQAVAAIGIATFVLAAILAPFFSHPEYSSVRHSLSELAGQHMPNAWIMRGGFVAFGLAILIAGLARLRSEPMVFGALAAFGAAMLAAALWSHIPIAQIRGGSTVEDDLHSIAASVMGGAFAFACGARLWARRKREFDGWSAVGLLVSTLIPLLMFQVPEIAGAAQRVMFLFSFCWILVAFGDGERTRSGSDRGP